MLSPRGSPKNSLTVSVSLRPQQRFNIVVCLLSYLPHSKYGVCPFFGDLHGRIDLELVPKLLYFSTVRRVFAFVVLLPLSTADVACPRFVHSNEPWRFRTISWFSIVSISPALCDWRQHRCFPRYFSSFLARLSCCCWTVLAHWHTFLLLLDLSCFLAYFSPRLTSLHFSPSHLILRHSSYCYCLWFHIVDHWLHIESPS